MSLVTNVMMQFSGADGDKEEDEEFGTDFKNLEAIQALVRKLADGQIFSEITDSNKHYSAGSNWGGSKLPETTVLAAAFNYLPLKDFIAAIGEMKWKEPHLFRLFVQEQGYGAFGVWIIRDGKLVQVVEQGAY
ncbi:MAG: hypothetical protein V4550_18320 [Gemmatimonadota bacterium]